MGVSSYFEFVTTMFGWILYDNFWSVLADSGVVYIPFIVLLFTNIVHSKRAGDDEGSAALQSLKKSETDIVLAIVVLFLAAVPFSNVSLGQMQFVRPTLDCRVVDNIAAGIEQGTVSGNATGTSFDPILATIGGQNGRIPIWWGVIHVLTKSVVAASVASIPCTGDMAAVNMTLENEKLDDQRVNRELQEFINDCFMPAKSQFLRVEQGAMNAATLDSTNYLGSTFFQTNSGYYDKFYSSAARPGWAFDPVRDGGFEGDQLIGGHPSCNEWWNDANVGLRQKILGAVDPDIIDEYIVRPRNLIQAATSANLSVADRENVFLRKFLAIKNAQANISGWGNDLSTSYSVGTGERLGQGISQGGFFGGAGAALTNGGKVAANAVITAVAGVGAAISLPGHLAAGIAAREGSTIFLSLILMIFVCVLPFLMVFSLYQIATLMTLTIVFFALHFAYVLFGIAFWMDNNLTTALMSGGGGAGIFTAVANPTQSLIMIWSQRFLYMVFPMFWVSSLAWVGVRAHNLMAGAQTLSGGSEAPMKAGGDAVSAVATKGASTALKKSGK